MCLSDLKIVFELTYISFASLKFFMHQMPPKDKMNGSIGSRCIKIIQSGAAYVYRTGTRVDHSSKNNRCRIFAKVITFIVGPSGESLSERKVKV